jgi:hypothetical protein
MVVDVVLVGCGLPGRGMGWYHALQMVDGQIPSANITDIVEPWFLDGGKNSSGGQTFANLVEEWKPKGVTFHASIATVPAPSRGMHKLALISGRTADNPRLLKEVIEAGCTCVYLEKPGAPTVVELDEMAAYAASRNVPVYMGCKFSYHSLDIICSYLYQNCLAEQTIRRVYLSCATVSTKQIIRMSRSMLLTHSQPR